MERKQENARFYKREYSGGITAKEILDPDQSPYLLPASATAPLEPLLLALAVAEGKMLKDEMARLSPNSPAGQMQTAVEEGNAPMDSPDYEADRAQAKPQFPRSGDAVQGQSSGRGGWVYMPEKHDPQEWESLRGEDAEMAQELDARAAGSGSTSAPPHSESS